MCVTSRLDDIWRIRIEQTASIEHTVAHRVVPYFTMTSQANKTESRDCHHNQDRLFALRGLWPSNIQFRFEPNYNISVDEVYTKFSRCALNDGTLEILDFAGLWPRESSEGDSNNSGSKINTTLPS
ncbi:hypothetical protein G7Y89_g4166 [Cudoniella acicularis]|uniref:Uncharacterized protein n=1 Tax=Cudoniella acicularis TaxID=354080 RepID=A0A8H4RPZ6_9HELO|nr:hypothetical protein G7Y89_g4166 [Cudoniella acicularis]